MAEPWLGMQSGTVAERVAIMGFGEAGSTFAAAGRWRANASAFDVNLARRQVIEDIGVVVGADPAATLHGAGTVLSLVTAAAAKGAAEACAPWIEPGTLWIDMNSVAPETKRAAAAQIERAGGRYVDAAILAPVESARLNVSILLAGPAAAHARNALTALGFANLRIVGNEVGQASSVKMIRSVMIKGIEALTGEMMAAAEAAGVTAEVLASLDASERNRPWAERAAYNLERMATHGVRRAEEMEEAAKALWSLGVEPVMTSGTVSRQRGAAVPPLSTSDAP